MPYHRKPLDHTFEGGLKGGLKEALEFGSCAPQRPHANVCESTRSRQAR
jgi:hypothetical protein